MKSLVLCFAFLLLPILALALDVASLRDCAFSPDSVVIDYDNGKSYLFRDRELFRVNLPPKSDLVSLSPTAFPGERQNCFDFTRGGRVKFEDLTSSEMKQCQSAKKQVPFASVSKSELSAAADVILGTYFELSEEIDSSLYAQEPDQKLVPKASVAQLADLKKTWLEQRRWGRKNLAQLANKFQPCEVLTGLSETARATQADLSKRFKQMTEHSLANSTLRREISGVTSASSGASKSTP